MVIHSKGLVLVSLQLALVLTSSTSIKPAALLHSQGYKWLDSAFCSAGGGRAVWSQMALWVEGTVEPGSHRHEVPMPSPQGIFSQVSLSWTWPLSQPPQLCLAAHPHPGPCDCLPSSPDSDIVPHIPAARPSFPRALLGQDFCSKPWPDSPPETRRLSLPSPHSPGPNRLPHPSRKNKRPPSGSSYPHTWLTEPVSA